MPDKVTPKKLAEWKRLAESCTGDNDPEQPLTPETQRGNMQFVATAREAVPALIDYIERLEKDSFAMSADLARDHERVTELERVLKITARALDNMRGYPNPLTYAAATNALIEADAALAALAWQIEAENADKERDEARAEAHAAIAAIEDREQKYVRERDEARAELAAKDIEIARLHELLAAARAISDGHSAELRNLRTALSFATVRREERERCAKLVEDVAEKDDKANELACIDDLSWTNGDVVAAMIRALPDEEPKAGGGT